MTILDAEQAGGFVAPVAGAVVIPSGGVYYISYEATLNAASVGVGIEVNAGGVLAGSVTSTFAANQRILGSIIVRLSTGDTVQLVNAAAATAITTSTPTGTFLSAPIICSLTFIKLAN